MADTKRRTSLTDMFNSLPEEERRRLADSVRGQYIGASEPQKRRMRGYVADYLRNRERGVGSGEIMVDGKKYTSASEAIKANRDARVLDTKRKKIYDAARKAYDPNTKAGKDALAKLKEWYDNKDNGTDLGDLREDIEKNLRQRYNKTMARSRNVSQKDYTDFRIEQEEKAARLEGPSDGKGRDPGVLGETFVSKTRGPRGEQIVLPKGNLQYGTIDRTAGEERRRQEAERYKYLYSSQGRRDQAAAKLHDKMLDIETKQLEAMTRELDGYIGAAGSLGINLGEPEEDKPASPAESVQPAKSVAAKDEKDDEDEWNNYKPGNA